MRRYYLLLLVLALACSFLGCIKSDIRTPISFYYCTNPVDYNTPNGVISAETREGSGFEEDQISLLNLYLKGPITDSYTSPFPENVSVESYSSDTSTAKIQLSPEFAVLSGHDLTIACVCISRTILDLSECSTVQISITDLPIDGNEYIEMSMDNFLFLDAFNTEPIP